MEFPKRYKIMGRVSHRIGDFELIPIRYQDRIDIMNWRNSQISHLRQKAPLTLEDQNNYFKETVAKLYEEDSPSQILFSYLENGKCIGYGGLVHIDWFSKNAEISFIVDPKLEKDLFYLHWKIYLELLYKYAFEDLNLHKIYTYAFDVRPYLYKALENGGLLYEAKLKEHYYFNGEFKDVVIHSKCNPIILDPNKFYLKATTLNDAETLFYWVNEPSSRKNSLNSDPISWENHISWFKDKLKNPNSFIYNLYNSNIEIPLGVIRLDYDENKKGYYISYSIDKLYRGQRLGVIIINLIEQKHPDFTLLANVKLDNHASINIFRKAAFKEHILDGHLMFSK